MGFCYDYRNRLCCDACDEAGGVRKRPCPFGYCGPAALCKACYAKHRAEFTKAAHEHCRKASEECKARWAREESMIAAGQLIRCAALQQDDGLVKVWFKGRNDSKVIYFMEPATYAAFPLGEIATPEDYRQRGILIPE
jgi:hypothetical protein